MVPKQPTARWLHGSIFQMCCCVMSGSLTLGTCDVNARIGGRSGKEDEQVAFLAWKDSKIWETKVMFGAALTLLPLANCLVTTWLPCCRVQQMHGYH